ncbi:MAG: DUF2341 domain-containing protein [Bacteroidota bacterium]
MKNKNTLSMIALRALLVLLTGFLTTQFLLAQDWYDTDWLSRTPITITNSVDNELSDYQVQVLLDDQLDWWSEIKSGGDDIRFTSADGVNPIDFWIEIWYESQVKDSAIIWVEVPSIAASPTTTTIYLYYNNSSAIGASDGEDTFDFFDGFDGDALDDTKWNTTIVSDASTSLANSKLTMTADEPSGLEKHCYVRINGDTTFLNGYVVETFGQHPDAGTKYLISETGFSSNDFSDIIRLANDQDNTDYWEKNARLNDAIGDYEYMDVNSDTDWHKFKVYRNTNGTVSFQIDQKTIEDYEDQEHVPYQDELSPFLMSFCDAGGGNEFIVDWTRVRKWADADPTTELGSQEDLYRWTGDTDSDWSDSNNWDPNQTPGLTNCILIPYVTNDPLISNLSPEIQYLKIDPSAILTIDPAGALTINGELSNNGTLKLESDASGIASLITDSYEGIGNHNIQIYLTGSGSEPYVWHYISPPVSGLSSTYFTETGDPLYSDIARYEEDLVSTDMNEGWVTPDGDHYNPGTDSWSYVSGYEWNTEYLSLGTGYNYSGSTNHTFTISSGTLNTAAIDAITLSYSGSSDNLEEYGYNLIGNPFTCGLDWDYVVDANSIWTNVEAAIYIRSGDGTSYAYIDGETVPDWGEPLSDGKLPPMQGFFIKANTSGNTLTIPTSAKTHTFHERFKSSSSTPLIRLEIENSGVYDQSVIRFKNEATYNFDNLYDARKLFAPENVLYISSSLEGTEYAINTIPFPENSDTIPLVINASAVGQYTITAKQLQGLENYNVYLVDKDQNFTTDLTENKTYSFASSKGELTDRFELIVASVVTGIEEELTIAKPFNIYSSMDLINVQTLSDEWNGKQGGIKIFDLTGRLIMNRPNIVFSEDEIIQLPLRKENGIYIVQINSGQMNFVSKIFVK